MTNEFFTLSKAYKLIYYGLMVYVLSIVIGIVGSMVVVGGAMAGGAAAPAAGGAGAAGGALDLFLIVIIGASIIAMIGSLMMLIGKFRCLAVPPEVDGAKTLIMLAVSFELFTMLLSVLGIMDAAMGQRFLPLQVQQALSLVSSVLTVAAMVLFLVFTGRVARYVRRRDLSASAMLIIKIAVVLIVGLILMMVTTVFMVAGAVPAPGAAPAGGGMPAGFGGTMALSCVTMVTVVVSGIALLVLYARLLTNMSTACARYARDEDRGEDRDGPDDEVDGDNPDDLDR